jgi:regulator of RNase E activity RraA
VPDNLLGKLRSLSAEDVWAILGSRGFNNQFEGEFRVMRPGSTMAGRVVTAQFMPVRPDLNDLITAGGKQNNYFGGQNQWVIDKLQPGDVLVVDLFGKVEGGTFVGDNLAFYIEEITKTAVWLWTAPCGTWKRCRGSKCRSTTAMRIRRRYGT